MANLEDVEHDVQDLEDRVHGLEREVADLRARLERLETPSASQVRRDIGKRTPPEQSTTLSDRYEKGGKLY